MRAYTLLFTLALNFTTFASYLVYAIGLSFSQPMLATKDLMLIIGVLLVLPSLVQRMLRLRVEPLDWLIILAVIFNLLSFVLSDALIADRIVNLRRHLSFLFVLFIFREYGTGFRSELSYFQFLKPVLILLWVFGITEFLLPDAFWNDFIGISGYWNSLSLDPFATSTIGESGRFYSWDLYTVMGEVRRMVSLYFEPTTLAAFFVACLCFSFIGGQRERLWTWLIAIFGLLTISKFFAMSIPLALAVIVLRDRLRKQMFLGFVAACIMITVGVIALDIDAGALAHLKGISSLVQIVMQNKWLGLGLGAGGNYSDTDLDTAEIGAESGFGNIAAQLGLMALIYVFLLNNIYVTLLECYQRTRELKYSAAIAALVCWTLSFFLSASSLGLSGNAFVFILIGSVLHNHVFELRHRATGRQSSLPSLHSASGTQHQHC